MSQQSQQIDAIYDGGVLRPLEPLALSDQAQVKLTIDAEAANESTEDTAGPHNGPCDDGGTGGGKADTEFDDDLESLLFDGPTLSPDFSRAAIYADHD